jgi:hypothetical protein
MKVDSRSFPESISTPESKSIRGRGGRHELLLFWNLNVTSVNLARITCFKAIQVCGMSLACFLPYSPPPQTEAKSENALVAALTLAFSRNSKHV